MIALKPMTLEEYRIYLDRAVAEYAEDKVQAGNWPEEGAVERSAKEYEKYLPNGLGTEDNTLCTLFDPERGVGVGMIWYASVPVPSRHNWFIFDFYIDPEQRRHGYASQALTALDLRAQEQGIQAIELHVFGHNTAARALYEKMGYEVTNINMRKIVGKGVG